MGNARRLALLAVLAVMFATLRTAHADNVDKLIRDLESDDYKVRLSATASLGKLGDDRAIEPLIAILMEDREKSVRGAAAVALGKIITSDTDGELAEAAVEALTYASKKDKQSFVKKQAAKALKKVQKALEGAGDSGGGGGGGIYVNVGEMSAKIDEDAETLRALMRKTVEKTFSSKASDWLIKWPGGKTPSKKDLKDYSAFYVDGTINEVSTKAKGGGIIVTCKVNMLIASFPDKSMFGFLDGKASVSASDDPSDIALASKDCVAAVVEDLTIKKIIPTIKAKAGG